MDGGRAAHHTAPRVVRNGANVALIVSVSGVRGLVGESFTPDVALEFAWACGSLLEGGRVALARDTRPSGPMYEAAAEAGLVAAGCQVVRLGVAMTPTVGHAIIAGALSGGLVVTASHNPAPWNGLKFLDDRGMAPDPARAARIASLREGRRFRRVKTGFQPALRDDDAGARHADAVRSAVEVELGPLRGVRVVLDSVNGAGCGASAEFLRSLGCEVVPLNGEPTGEFAHAPEPLAENLTSLCEAVRRRGAAVGFAQDPDADRLAIVDERGQYVGEEYTLALAAWSVLSRRPGPVAANLSTSRMIDDVAARFGAPVLRTPVGEANVARAMLDHAAVVGGEGNGGVIDPRISPVRDSLSAMSLVMQLMAATGKSVSALVEDLPRYVIVKRKFEADPPHTAAAVAAVASAFADRRPNLTDGVRVDLPEGWVHLRGSNTEPIVRIIAEARDEASAASLIERVRRVAGLGERRPSEPRPDRRPGCP